MKRIQTLSSLDKDGIFTAEIDREEQAIAGIRCPSLDNYFSLQSEIIEHYNNQKKED